MSDKHIPYFNFYPSDFMGGTRGLSAQQVGVYMMLLCKIYEDNGPVKFDSYKLSTYCGMRENTFIKIFDQLVRLDKLQHENGAIFNDRAQTEISSRANTLKNNSKAGKVSAQKRQQKQRSNPTGVQRAFNHTDSDTDTNTDKEVIDTTVSISDTQTELIPSEPAKPKAKRKKPRTPLPEDFQMPEDWKPMAIAKGIPDYAIAEQFEKFKDNHIGRGNVMADWKRAWGTWTGNYQDFKPRGNSNGSGSYNQGSNGGVDAPSSTNVKLTALRRAGLRRAGIEPQDDGNEPPTIIRPRFGES